MVRSFLPRASLFRAFVPRVSTPILPLSTSLRSSNILTTSTPRPQTSSRHFHHSPSRLSTSSSEPPSPTGESHPPLPPDASLSQKLKYLIKSYGWYALGVYIILSALDFSVAFAGIHLLGAEHVTKVTATVKEFVGGYLPAKPTEPGREEVENVPAQSATAGLFSGHEGLYAMIVLAYTVHKTLFLPVRVGLTAALTPRLVGWLRTRGWAGKAGAKRAGTEMRDRMRRRSSSGSSD